MIRPVVRDVLFLSQKSEPAVKEDMPAARDLLDTLAANSDRCVGMAANMIGVRKNIIAVSLGMVNMIMFNPVITEKSGPYLTEEGCLSLDGTRKTARFKDIEVEFRDMGWELRKKRFSGRTAQIIQHEADHLAGRII